MFDFRTSPGSPDCRGEGSFPVCRLSRSGRRSVGSDYSQCLGGHVARNRRTRTTFEPRPGHACAQGVATQVPHGGDRLDAHSLSRETGPRQKGNLPRRTQVGHHSFPRLCYGGGSPQRVSLHLGDHARRIRRLDERGASAVVGDRPSPRRKNPISPAGQGFFQRGGYLLSSSGWSRIHPSRRRAGTKAQGSEDASARTASVVEEEKRLLSRDDHLGANQGKKENQRDGKHLRRQQVLYPRGDRPAASETASLRGVEGAANARGNPGNLPQTFWDRNELPTDERSEDQNMHARSTAAAALRWHCPGVAQCVGVDSFSVRERKIQQ